MKLSKIVDRIKKKVNKFLMLDDEDIIMFIQTDISHIKKGKSTTYNWTTSYLESDNPLSPRVTKFMRQAIFEADAYLREKMMYGLLETSTNKKFNDSMLREIVKRVKYVPSVSEMDFELILRFLRNKSKLSRTQLIQLLYTIKPIDKNESLIHAIGNRPEIPSDELIFLYESTNIEIYLTKEIKDIFLF